VEESAEGAKNPAKAVSPPAAASPKPVRNKVVTFESNFEDCYGKAHLEVRMLAARPRLRGPLG
jgi:hypothetical protein